MVFTRTTLSGLQALLFLAVRRREEPIVPARIAERLGLSASYLAKVARRLVRANILTARRGAKGGVSLSRPPSQITLLEIVEACQGRPWTPPSLDAGPPERMCAFHRAWRELHDGTTGTLRRWTLADLAANPCPTMAAGDTVCCLLSESQVG